MRWGVLVQVLLWVIIAASACTGPGATVTPVATTAVSTTAVPHSPPLTPGLASPLPVPSSTSLPATTATSTAPSLPTATPTPSAVVFAVIGDYGLAGQAAADVAQLVKRWQPDFIITTGDNNYPNGAAVTIDENIGQYYHEFIHPYRGEYGQGATTNRFFPAMGNHDWYTLGARPYLDYFTLPGNERYYDFTWGPLHLFAVNSAWQEPDGFRSTSVQADWLRQGLAASTSPWKLVYMHVPPFSSGYHGSAAWMQWPFAEWGATAVMAGHDHHYERLLIDGVPYFVNGLGGGARYSLGAIVPGSQVQYQADHGAMRVEASDSEIRFEFITRHGEVIDSYTITAVP